MIDWSNVFAEALPYALFLDRYANPAQRERWQAIHARFSLTVDQWICSLVFRAECQFFAWRELGAVTASTTTRFLIISLSLRLRSTFASWIVMPDPKSALCWPSTAVTVLVFLSEDWFEVAWCGDRPLSTYRRMAAERLGLAYLTELVPSLAEAIATITAEWLDESERSQLILWLSPQLQTRYGDWG
jgi:hypothetical protein